MTEQGNPLSAVTRITSQEFLKHVPLMKAQTSTLETKQIMIERGSPLFAVKSIPPDTEKWLRKNYTKTFTTTRAMRPSVRPTTASTTSAMT